MTDTLRIDGHDYRIQFLDEPSLEYEFLHMFVDDAYGLSLLKEIRTIVDVGANHGFFGLCARGWFPDAVIHGYEPNPRVWQCFEHNYGLVRAVPFREAVGSSDARAEIQHIGDSISARTKPTSDSSGIPLVSLARAIDRIGGEVDLLKLDCEGAEWEILEAREPLGRVKAITMEYHDFGLGAVPDYRTHAEFLLRDNGFDIVRHVPVNRYGQILAVRSS